MKDVLLIVLILVLLLLVAGLASAALAITTQSPSAIPAPMLQVGAQDGPQNNGATDRGDNPKMFTGKIVSLNGSRFILRDDTNQVWYHLDDQTTASKFAGRDIDVGGKLDERTDIIHVQSTEEQKRMFSL